MNITLTVTNNFYLSISQDSKAQEGEDITVRFVIPEELNAYRVRFDYSNGKARGYDYLNDRTEITLSEPYNRRGFLNLQLQLDTTDTGKRKTNLVYIHVWNSIYGETNKNVLLEELERLAFVEVQTGKDGTNDLVFYSLSGDEVGRVVMQESDDIDELFRLVNELRETTQGHASLIEELQSRVDALEVRTADTAAALEEHKDSGDHDTRYYTQDEIDNKFTEFEYGQEWKRPVQTVSDLTTTYPNPEIGWTAIVLDENIAYTWNGTEWVQGSAQIPIVTEDNDGLMTPELLAALNKAGVDIEEVKGMFDELDEKYVSNGGTLWTSGTTINSLNLEPGQKTFVVVGDSIMNSWTGLQSNALLLITGSAGGQHVIPFVAYFYSTTNGLLDNRCALGVFYFNGNSTAPINYKMLNLDGVATTAQLDTLEQSLITSINTKAPILHTSLGTATYGAATATQFGHVKLSDAIDEELNTSDTTAATPKAVFDALAAAKQYTDENSGGSGGTSEALVFNMVGRLSENLIATIGKSDLDLYESYDVVITREVLSGWIEDNVSTPWYGTITRTSTASIQMQLFLYQNALRTKMLIWNNSTGSPTASYNWLSTETALKTEFIIPSSTNASWNRPFDETWNFISIPPEVIELYNTNSSADIPVYEYYGTVRASGTGNPRRLNAVVYAMDVPADQKQIVLALRWRLATISSTPAYPDIIHWEELGASGQGEQKEITSIDGSVAITEDDTTIDLSVVAETAGLRKFNLVRTGQTTLGYINEETNAQENPLDGEIILLTINTGVTQLWTGLRGSGSQLTKLYRGFASYEGNVGFVNAVSADGDLLTTSSLSRTTGFVSDANVSNPNRPNTIDEVVINYISGAITLDNFVPSNTTDMFITLSGTGNFTTWLNSQTGTSITGYVNGFGFYRPFATSLFVLSDTLSGGDYTGHTYIVKTGSGLSSPTARLISTIEINPRDNGINIERINQDEFNIGVKRVSDIVFDEQTNTFTVTDISSSGTSETRDIKLPSGARYANLTKTTAEQVIAWDNSGESSSLIISAGSYAFQSMDGKRAEYITLTEQSIQFDESVFVVYDFVQATIEVIDDLSMINATGSDYYVIGSLFTVNGIKYAYLNGFGLYPNTPASSGGGVSYLLAAPSTFNVSGTSSSQFTITGGSCRWLEADTGQRITKTFNGDYNYSFGDVLYYTADGTSILATDASAISNSAHIIGTMLNVGSTPTISLYGAGTFKFDGTNWIVG